MTSKDAIVMSSAVSWNRAQKRTHAKADNPHGLVLLPAAQSDMSGVLMLQGHDSQRGRWS